jgi:YbbR domain-containing protein
MKQFWENIVALAASNLGLKVLALVIAVGLWVAGHRDIERAIEVPVEFRNIPADLIVLDNRVDYVVLRLTGPRTLVSTLDSDDVKLRIDLSGAKSGSVSYPLGPASFNVPRGVTATRITPPVVHLRLEPVIRRTLPVQVKLSGKPIAGYQITSMMSQPETIAVSGPADELKRLSSVETLPVDIDGGRGVIKRKVRLSTDGKPFSFLPDQVEVVVTVEEEETTREFSGIVVRARDFKGVFTVTPQSISLRVSGPKSVLDKLELKGDEAYLNLKGLPAGEHQLPLIVELPAGFRVMEQKPPRVRVRITKPGA